MTRKKVARPDTSYLSSRGAQRRGIPLRLRVTRKGSLFCHLDERGDERSLSRGIPRFARDDKEKRRRDPIRLICHPEERSDEGSLSAPGHEKGILAALRM